MRAIAEQLQIEREERAMLAHLYSPIVLTQAVMIVSTPGPQGPPPRGLIDVRYGPDTPWPWWRYAYP